MTVRPRLLAIAGPSGAGKSTLAEALLERLPGADLLTLDSYYRELAEPDPKRRAARNFDHPEALDRPLLARQLDELAAGRPVEVPIYRFDTHERDTTTRRLVPQTWIVVEGLHALYFDELRRHATLRIFVDASDEVCLERRILRDVVERGRTEASVREQFGRTVLPMLRRFVAPTCAQADLVVDGVAPLAEAVRQVLFALRGQL